MRSSASRGPLLGSAMGRNRMSGDEASSRGRSAPLTAAELDEEDDGPSQLIWRDDGGRSPAGRAWTDDGKAPPLRAAGAALEAAVADVELETRNGSG